MSALIEKYDEKTDKAKAKTDQAVRKQVLDTLARLGEVVVKDDSLVFEGTKFVLPKTMTVRNGIKFLEDYERQQEKHFAFDRQFNYRPSDGAHAFELALRDVFGTSGFGKSTQTFFGETPPRYRTINISPTDTIQVPQGEVRLNALDATFYVASSQHEDFGPVFHLGVEAPRKYRAHIEAFFRIVEQKLSTHSIYRGKAITGAVEPAFIDVHTTDPDRVIYSAEVLTQLDTNLWSLIEYTEQMRTHGIPLKRAVLVEGKYGTGKTLAGQLTAQRAIDNGWTFILARPGKDDLMQVLATAQLYAPAVVWYEDIDVVAQGHSETQVSMLLDALDGITAKGAAVLAAFTSNHADKIQKGMLRPGRIDAVIHIGDLDAEGIVKLIKATIPKGQLAKDIVWESVVDAFQGLLPAFAKEAADRAMRYTMARNAGQLHTINTDDLVHAAAGLRPQLELMEGAAEGVKPNVLDKSLTKLMQNAVNGTRIVDSDGDHVEGWTLEPIGANGKVTALS